jgi:hypothetical protein
MQRKKNKGCQMNKMRTMKRISLIILVAFGALLTACEKSGDPEASLDISLHDCTGAIFSGDDIRLCFDSVISDSRCPANLVCVWQGMAEVQFTLIKHSQTHVFKLTLPSDTILAGYKINLLELNPYPGLPPTTPPSNDKRVKVKITKL